MIIHSNYTSFESTRVHGSLIDRFSMKLSVYHVKDSYLISTASLRCLMKFNKKLSYRWQTRATRYVTTNGKILKQSRDHNHALFVGDMSSCCIELILLTCIQNLTTLGSAVPVIWLEPQNFVMGHILTWPSSNQRQFVVRIGCDLRIQPVHQILSAVFPIIKAHGFY